MLGGVRYAVLRIGGELYKIKYSVVVIKAMTALEVYSEAIQWIEFKKMRGIVDYDLADQAIDYLRNKYKREFPT